MADQFWLTDTGNERKNNEDRLSTSAPMTKFIIATMWLLIVGGYSTGGGSGRPNYWLVRPYNG